MRAALIVLIVLLILGLLPVLVAMGAMLVAAAAGCDLDAGSAHPCLILGTDWGEALHAATMLHWLGLVTLPVAALAALGIILLALVWLIRYLRR